MLDEEELRFVIGHELGHVLSGHAVYRSMLDQLLVLSRRIFFLPVGYLGLRALLTGILDNTSQVHCNLWMVEQQPERYVGGQLIVFGGIPFNLCLGISSADVGDNALADLRYITGRHTAPSNADFDVSLRARNPEWGVRDVAAVSDLAGRHGLVLVERVAMPVNNLSLVFRFRVA